MTVAQPIPIDNLLTRLINDSHDVSLIWQLGVLAVCALLAWGAVRLIKPYLNKPESLWSPGRVGICRVGFPLLMLLGVLLGQACAWWYTRCAICLSHAIHSRPWSVRPSG
jgi:hypothetical protein